MLWAYGIVFLLVIALVIPNGLYAFRQYLANRNLVLLTVYFGFLMLLAYLLLHVTTRTAELVQTAKEVYEEPGP
jgi:hypothetical protein